MREEHFARVDPATAIAPLFAALPTRGVPTPLDARHRFADLDLHWRGPTLLSATEQSILLAVVAIAGVERRLISEDPATDAGRALRAAMDVSGFARHEDAVLVSASWRELCRLSGLGVGGGNLRQARKALMHLAEVTLWVQRERATASTRLLSWLIGDDASVLVALNYRLARTVCGGQFARISITERNTLTTTPAKLLHAWLSATHHAGRVRVYRIDTLAKHVWTGDATGSTLRTRRERVREALREISALPGWAVVIDGETAHVSRHRTGSTDASAETRRQSAAENPHRMQVSGT